MTGDPALDAAQQFAEAVAIMARLRGENGCPWDREQTFDTIRKYTLEEAYEVFDAIERRNWADLRDELGDLLLQVLFYAQMAAEPGYFTIADVIAGLNRKLIRRHPHVFGDQAAAAAGNAAPAGMEIEGIDAQQVLRNWDAIKAAEKASQPEDPSADQARGRLDGIPRALPALMEASKLGSRAAKAGFDWPNPDGLFDKIHEEVQELREAIAADRLASTEISQQAVVGRGRRPALHGRESRPSSQNRSGIRAARDEFQIPPALRRHGIDQCRPA